MNSTPVRLIIIAVLVAVSSVWIERVRKESVPDKVFLPKVDLKEMPLDLGGWRGVDTELDPEVFRTVDAIVSVNREYQSLTGRLIRLHCAAFGNYVVALPHDPRICFRGNGYQILREEKTKLYLDAGSDVPVHLLEMQRSGKQFQALYWYQVGDRVVADGDAMRVANWKWRSKESRPALFKVLLETEARDPVEGAEDLRTFAAFAYRWLESIQKPGDMSRTVDAISAGSSERSKEGSSEKADSQAAGEAASAPAAKPSEPGDTPAAGE